MVPKPGSEMDVRSLRANAKELNGMAAISGRKAL